MCAHMQRYGYASTCDSFYAIIFGAMLESLCWVGEGEGICAAYFKLDLKPVGGKEFNLKHDNHPHWLWWC